MFLQGFFCCDGLFNDGGSVVFIVIESKCFIRVFGFPEGFIAVSECIEAVFHYIERKLGIIGQKFERGVFFKFLADLL